MRGPLLIFSNRSAYVAFYLLSAEGVVNDMSFVREVDAFQGSGIAISDQPTHSADDGRAARKPFYVGRCGSLIRNGLTLMALYAIQS